MVDRHLSSPTVIRLGGVRDVARADAQALLNARHLEPHRGPILSQLPPRWPLNLERLDSWGAWLADRVEEGREVFACARILQSTPT